MPRSTTLTPETGGSARLAKIHCIRKQRFALCAFRTSRTESVRVAVRLQRALGDQGVVALQNLGQKPQVFLMHPNKP
jgi:hypothetical protein